MSEEAAFLEALKANPADDTARLVFADWLDEHDEPAKAEYLRLVTVLAQAEQDYAREEPEVARLFVLAETLPQEWREAAGSRFKLVFYACERPAKIVATIKAVREVSGFGLADAKAAVEGAPSELLVGAPFELGFVARDKVREAGANAFLHPFDRTDRPVAIFHDIIAVRERSQEAECKSAFASFLQTAMNIGAVEARRLAENPRVTVAHHQDPLVAGAKTRELRQHIEWDFIDDGLPETQPVWGIRVWAVPAAQPPHDTE